MAFTRIALALAEGRPFTLYGDGAQHAAGRTSATSSRRPSRRWRGSGTYNVGGALEASLRDAIAILERLRERRST
jgi:hypothetical protein